MNEYWQSEDHCSYCFCHGGDWYQVKKNDPIEAEWHFCPVTMDRGLPVEMHLNLYHEVDRDTMMNALPWTAEELEARIRSQLDRIG